MSYSFITEKCLQEACVGQFYAQPILIVDSQGVPIIVQEMNCSAAPVDLPAGLTFNEEVGLIYGTPTQYGCYKFTITINIFLPDQQPIVLSKEFKLKVGKCKCETVKF